MSEREPQEIDRLLEELESGPLTASDRHSLAKRFRAHVSLQEAEIARLTALVEGERVAGFANTVFGAPTFSALGDFTFDPRYPEIRPAILIIKEQK